MLNDFSVPMLKPMNGRPPDPPFYLPGAVKISVICRSLEFEFDSVKDQEQLNHFTHFTEMKMALDAATGRKTPTQTLTLTLLLVFVPWYHKLMIDKQLCKKNCSF